MTRWVLSLVMLPVAAVTGTSTAASTHAPHAAHAHWTLVSGTAPVPSVDQPAIHRYGHEVEVAWVQNGTSGGDVLMTRRFDSRTGAAKGGSHKVMPAWSGLNNQTQLIGSKHSRLLVFSGIRDASNNDPYDDPAVFSLASNDGKAWTLQPGSLTHTNAAVDSSGLAATGSATSPVVAVALSPEAWITYHFGASSTIPAGSPDGETTHDTKCCVYDPGLARDAHGGQVWVTWYSNSANAGWNGVNAQAIPTGKHLHAPSSSTTFGGAPNSVSADQSVQVASRPKRNHGGVYTAYGVGYPTATDLAVWKLGASKPAIMIKTRDRLATIGISAGLGGRLWVYWTDRTTGKIRVALTNTKATKVASTFTLSPPNAVSRSPFNLVGDGSDSAKGRLNLVALLGGTKTRLYFTQVKP